MRLEGEHTFSARREDVWRALQDPQVLANTLPGVRRLEVAGPDRYAVTVTVGVGAVKGAYDGTFSLSEKRDLESCTVIAEATGTPGSVSTTAAMVLRDAEAGGTQLSYDADAKVTGALAGVGQRMVAAAARKTTREFLAAIDRELTGATPSAASETEIQVTDDSAARGVAPPAPPAGVFVPSSPAGGSGERELRLVGTGMLAGFLLAVAGILIGRRTARR